MCYRFAHWLYSTKYRWWLHANEWANRIIEALETRGLCCEKHANNRKQK